MERRNFLHSLGLGLVAAPWALPKVAKAEPAAEPFTPKQQALINRMLAEEKQRAAKKLADTENRIRTSIESEHNSIITFTLNDGRQLQYGADTSLTYKTAMEVEYLTERGRLEGVRKGDEWVDFELEFVRSLEYPVTQPCGWSDIMTGDHGPGDDICEPGNFSFSVLNTKTQKSVHFSKCVLLNRSWNMFSEQYSISGRARTVEVCC